MLCLSGFELYSHWMPLRVVKGPRGSSTAKSQADVKTGADKCAVRTTELTSRAGLSHFSFYCSPRSFPVPRFSNIPPYVSATRGDGGHSDHSR